MIRSTLGFLAVADEEVDGEDGYRLVPTAALYLNDFPVLTERDVYLRDRDDLDHWAADKIAKLFDLIKETP